MKRNLSRSLKLAPVALALALAACVTVPPGPRVMALPGDGKSFDQFRADDYECRGWASEQSGASNANQVAADSGIRSAAVGTLIGAIAGAAIGGHQGAGVGAGVGMIGGGLAGTGAAQQSAGNVQQRYDNAYTQCMYGKGQRVPTTARFDDGDRYASRRRAPPPPPPPGYYQQQPPASYGPPPGYYPPPR